MRRIIGFTFMGFWVASLTCALVCDTSRYFEDRSSCCGSSEVHACETIRLAPASPVVSLDRPLPTLQWEQILVLVEGFTSPIEGHASRRRGGEPPGLLSPLVLLKHSLSLAPPLS